MSGYIYCFSNPSMPGILKVGMTDRTPEIRLFEANGPDTWRPPTPYKIVFAKKVLNPYQKETTLHAILSQNAERINPKREFFRVSQEEVKTLFDLIDGELWVENTPEEEVSTEVSTKVSTEVSTKVSTNVSKNCSRDIMNCKRCGYTTKVVFDLKSHLQRKYVCSPILEDIDVNILYNEYFEKPIKNYNCEYCDKTYSYLSGKNFHLKTCSKKIELELLKTNQLELLKKQFEDYKKENPCQLDETCVKTLITNNNRN